MRGFESIGATMTGMTVIAARQTLVLFECSWVGKVPSSSDNEPKTSLCASSCLAPGVTGELWRGSEEREKQDGGLRRTEQGERRANRW